MEKVIAFFVVLSLSAQSFAVGIEDSNIYKENPKQQVLLKIYWDRFLRAKAINTGSGDQIAAAVLLADIENDLLDEGFDAEQLLRLGAEAESISAAEHKAVTIEVEEKLKKDAIFDLLERIDVAPIEEIDGKVKTFLRSYAHLFDQPKYLKIFESLPRSDLLGDQSAFRFNARLMIIWALNLGGFDFTRPPGTTTMDATLRVLYNWIPKAQSGPAWDFFIHKTKINSKDPIGVGNINIEKSLRDKLIKRWKRTYTIDRKAIVREYFSRVNRIGPAGLVFLLLGLGATFSIILQNQGVYAPGKLVSWTGETMLALAAVSLGTFYYLRAKNQPRSRGVWVLRRCGLLGSL